MRTKPELGRASSEPAVEAAVEVEDLVKVFSGRRGEKVTAVDSVTFRVETGEVFGFLGPNGAGKTTTLEIIEGLQAPTSGRTRVLGFDSVADREEMKGRIGVQLQSGAYFNYLTLEEILDLFGSFYPRRLSPAELLEKVGLTEKAGAYLPQLSGGQAQRFSIIAALVNDPEVVFLDEPTTGLDPQARHNLWDLIRYLNDEEHKTVVLTTHYMEEAEVLCDRVAIIDHGKIQALDTPLELIHTLEAPYRVRFSLSSEVPTTEFESLPGVAGATPWSNGMAGYELSVSDAHTTLGALLAWAEGSRAQLEDLRVIPATLEDVFLSLTGRSLRE